MPNHPSTIRILFITLFITALSGCMTTVKKEAFAPTKTYAIVSISSFDSIQKRGQNASLLGMLKSASSESGFSGDATKMFNGHYKLVIDELQKMGHFTLLPEKKVTGNEAYRKTEGDNPDGIIIDMISPDGYKYFTDAKKMQQLAKDLKVDGVIALSMQYSFATSGVGIGGLFTAGRQRALTRVTVYAVDTNGEYVWNDTIEQRSEDYLGVLGESGNFTKLEPLFREATVTGTKELIARLSQQLQ